MSSTKLIVVGVSGQGRSTSELIERSSVSQSDYHPQYHHRHHDQQAGGEGGGGGGREGSLVSHEDDDLIRQQLMIRRASIISSSFSSSGGTGDHDDRIHRAEEDHNIHAWSGNYNVQNDSTTTHNPNTNNSVAVCDHNHEEEEEGLELPEWAAIERLPTFRRIRTSLLLLDDPTATTATTTGNSNKINNSNSQKKKVAVIDVTKLGSAQAHVFVDRLLKKIDEDNRRLLLRLQRRLHRVGLKLPTIEVRYANLSVEAECQVVRGKPLPSLWNSVKSFVPDILNRAGGHKPSAKLKILRSVSGIIKPSRMTLLLGPPGSGKTTLLLALAGKLDQNLKATGEISYNGYKINEFVPQKTSAYISQHDLHISEMTVRETLDFSARCQGIGSRAEIIAELSRREKEAGIIPEPDIDTYMKALAAEGSKPTVQIDYVLKVLGLDSCSETIVGNDLRSGISGGQKKRLTTGEIIIGPSRVLLMDEISNGLDSSTTFQVATYLQQWTHITGSTVLVSLLQPAPETFDLFDDVILMAEGKIVYHGPRTDILDFFFSCGFKCPPRKSTADFLHEVVSRKDQSQYWYHQHRPHVSVSVEEFSDLFKQSRVGKELGEQLSQPFQRSELHKNALSFYKYSVSKLELLKACTTREWLLMKRNSFVHVFKSAQLVITALISVTLFIRGRTAAHKKKDLDITHANFYTSTIFYAIIRLLCSGIAELSLTVSRLGVFYKQRDFYFYPAWAYSIPAVILKVPFSFLDAFIWTTLTYYGIGYSPEINRVFRHFLLIFLLHQVSVSIFRLLASVFRNPSVAASSALFSLVVMLLFGGFIIPKPSLPAWLRWGFWLSPITYAEIGASINEFLAPRWQKGLDSNANLGRKVLQKHGLSYGEEFYWISVGALIGFWLIFNIAFTIALHYLQAPGRSKRIISRRTLSQEGEKSNCCNISEQTKSALSSETPDELRNTNPTDSVLPFEPMAVTFENLQYFVESPKRIRDKGFKEKKLQLLQDVTGVFRPGILAALMGVSGAGKTTLMDVLSGRKTRGVIQGDIRVGGYPKVQQTYARISGYCEQIDIHSPQITIEESVMYSAWLRLPSHIGQKTKSDFVTEVLQMIELDNIKDALVGFPGLNGISAEQRKRLTIAVELVSNPTIIFMDEPTTGLDARAAAIVMRVVKNITQTRRTVVCTIHQPSIDVFEAFDELILMKKGGQIIYSGKLGQNSSQLIGYFENIPGVAKIEENRNPATWMLDVTSASAEAQLGLDFACIYKASHLYPETKRLVRELRSPTAQGELRFATRFRQNGWEQLKACLWKKNLSYWRSPKYNLVRLTFVASTSLLFGALLWQKGQKINDEQDLFNMLGSLFILVQFMGIGNCSSILPFMATERSILYRERFSGMYSSWAYSLAQVIIEIPYVLVQTLVFLIITYPSIDFYLSADKLVWYFYTMFCTLLSFTYFGMLLVSLTPSFQVASVVASFCYTMFTLFSGFIIPAPKIPKWWIWCYWICPPSWSLRGLLSSQYGDIDTGILVFGERKAISSFMDNYFGYHHHNLKVVALVLACFPILFALVFAWATSNLNFQRR
ncbi:pleiotropic drug resistance protein 3-like isoform X1 [Coffea arabica]|uniref:Pleiotropic drug resistance protein 3-like isoform X1 n=1 Tax=Coffea arabica TaxID=13443 RepID=A0ABM4W2H8_COFAR